LYRKFFKPLFDLSLALVLLIFASPVLLLFSLILYFVNNGKVLFKQLRPGLNGKIFTIYKFQTMTEARNANGELLPDAERLTSVGKFLRKTSLDELPQLFNVLKGDMSLVGPRPLLVEYLPLYSAEQARRHAVKPGITGWAQVNGRNKLSWPEKFALDLWYVEHFSWKLDLKIFALTFLKIFRSHDVNADENIPMEKFTGNIKNPEPREKP
jgi:lipopolysaccharide/colanic/teichoic acid biosynthesis glycosyltransferase